MTMVSQDADWVIVGLDRGLTYEKLALAALALERGARFLGTNPDRSFPTERGLEPGAGAILAALQATTGQEPITIGKPHPLMLELAMRHMQADPAGTAMLGDRLDTDIAAAEAAGIPAILVLTGVSTRGNLAESPFHPALVVDTLPELLEKWRSEASPRR
jgi:4-nitrophenyl phosphatase